ncbi:MAG: DUF4331 domain-containing protein [Chloroflexota bacterium]
MSSRSKAVGIAGALLIAASSVTGVFASSHREAPLIAGDPAADNTDLYAFVSPNNPNSLTIIANYVPLEDPAGGPNFFPFDPAVRYEIHVDNNGDGTGDVNYTFRFKTIRKAKNFAGIPTFLYNDGPIDSLNDPNLLARQTYSVWRNGSLIAADVPTPPVNIGPRSTAEYGALAASAVKTLGNGTKLFAGQRDDAFFVDLGSIFDLAGLRPFNALHAIPLAPADGVDGVSGFNTNSIAIEIPIQTLTRDHALPTGPNDSDADLGIWAAASRRKYRTLNANGTMSTSGPWQQVSRLGNPLINEVVIPTTKKDYWNGQKPNKDSQFASYYKAPELTAVANVLYDALDTPATTNRGDLVAILLTGLDIPSSGVVPGGLHYTRTGSTQADMLRVNTGIKPNAAGACVFGVAGGGTPSRLGALDGDLCGFPNGRRLADDVTDIEVRALLEGYGPTLNAVLGVPNRTPNNLIGDGVDSNADMPFLSAFPFIGLPHQGYAHFHEHGATEF